MKSNLIHHIQNHVHLDDCQAEMIFDAIQHTVLKNKEFVLEAGNVCKSYYFVEKGCLRMYFNNNKGVDQITHFALDNWWITDYFSFSDQIPSQYYIQAVGKSEVLSIDHDRFELLLQEIPVLERYFRIMMQRAVAASQERIKLLYSLSKEELFVHFNTYFPQFVQQVPQYMIASYLGLTPEYVSEIKKKKG